MRFITFILCILYSSFVMADQTSKFIARSRVVVPAFEAFATNINPDFIIEEIYVELRAEFIGCVIACEYSSLSKRIPISFQQKSQELLIVNENLLRETFTQLGSRLSECGASLVVKASRGHENFLSRILLYKRYSDVDRKSCSNTKEIHALIESNIESGLHLTRWLGPL